MNVLRTSCSTTTANSVVRVKKVLASVSNGERSWCEHTNDVKASVSYTRRAE